MRRIAAPIARLHRDGVSATVKASETWTSEEWIVPLCLVRGNHGLHGSKRGAVSEGEEAPRLHSSHGADEAVDDDIFDRSLGLPIQELRDGRWGSSILAGGVAARRYR